MRRKKKWSVSRIAAISAVGILAATSAVYAGTRFYQMYLEKQGNYGVKVGIQTTDNQKVILPEKIKDVDIFARYIPEGMEWIDEWHLEYPEHERNGGFSFTFSLLDGENVKQIVEDANVVESQEKMFGEYEGVYLKYDNLNVKESFSQRIYLFCPDLYRVLTVYIGDDVAKEDAIKVVENLVLTEKDTMINSEGLVSWKESVMPEVEENEEEEITCIEADKLPIYQIGKTFDIDVTGENENGKQITNRISVCVDSVQDADDLQVLEPDKIPVKWKDAVDAGGKLISNTLSYIKSGDGIENLDEVIKTEAVKQKLVYATVTYTNTSDEIMNHMLYIGSLITMEKQNGKYWIYVPEEQKGNGYDRVIWEGAASTGEMKYFSVSENYGNGGNYISSLKPGESISVNMAWIVNENDLKNLYLNLNGDGSAYAFSDSMQKNGVVELTE